MAVFSELPAANFGTRAAGISTFSVGFRGLTPVRAFRSCTVNLPKPVKLTSPPCFNVSVIASRKACTARSESCRLSPLRRETSATNSCRFTPLTLAQQIARAEERTEPDGVPREGVGAPLLAVDDTDGRLDDESRAAQLLDGLEERAAGRHHVLDHAHALARLEDAFDALRRSVLLRLSAHDHEGQPGRQRGGGCERDRAELRSREQRRVIGVLAHNRGDALAQRAQQVRARLEPVLVEVVLRALARAEQEVALEVRRLAERLPELVAHRRASAPEAPRFPGRASAAWPPALPAACSASRAGGSSASASGEPSTYETIEPSAK